MLLKRPTTTKPNNFGTAASDTDLQTIGTVIGAHTVRGGEGTRFDTRRNHSAVSEFIKFWSRQ